MAPNTTLFILPGATYRGTKANRLKATGKGPRKQDLRIESTEERANRAKTKVLRPKGKRAKRTTPESYINTSISPISSLHPAAALPSLQTNQAIKQRFQTLPTPLFF